MIAITDVTLRDGLQMESRPVSTERKLELLLALGRCGFDRIELTSFSHPGRMPQFADAEDLCGRVYAGPHSKLPPLMAFTPNERGTERLLAFPIPWVACFVSVSETFNQKNVRASIDESLAEVEATVKRVRQAKRKVRVYVSTVYGCPYEGAPSKPTRTRVLKAVSALGPDEIALGDTIGVATPAQVREVIAEVKSFFAVEKTAAHFHNTYGLGLCAAHAAYDVGIRLFDGATGGIGGCPYAKGASGNLSSEDLAYAFWREGHGKFQADGFSGAIKLLADSGLQPQGSLAQIWQKGGEWFGVKEGIHG